jgi:hypothetical protein
MKLLLISFSVIFLVTITYSQSIDSISLANNTILQYQDILTKLHKLKSYSKGTAELKAQDLLCVPSDNYFPFPNLYKSDDCNNSSINNAFKYFPDCTKEEFQTSIGDYLVNIFLKSNSQIIPEIKNSCIISKRKGVIIIRFESKGEIVENNCSKKWLSRIAVINFIKGDAYIAAIRFPLPSEARLPCQNAIEKPQDNEVANTIYLENELATVMLRVAVLEKEIQSINKKLKIAQDSLSYTNNYIVKMTNLLILKNDSLKLNREALAKSILQNKSLTDKYIMLQNSYSDYQKDVKNELQILQSSLKNINSQIDAFGTKVVNTVKSYEKFDMANTSFLAFNYGLVQAPYNPKPSSNNIEDPIKNSFHEEDLTRNFGVAYHRPNIGYYISNLRINSNEAPSPLYTTFDFDEAKEEFFIKGIPFTDLKYVSSGHNISTINFGLSFYIVEILNIKNSKKVSAKDTLVNYLNPKRTPQIPILNSLYFMLGTSFVQGQIWHYYDGYFPGDFSKDLNTGYYALDLSYVNKTGITLGLTYLKPYFQFEVGYNTLYSDFYINLGANIPIIRSNARLRRSKSSSSPHEERNIQRIREDVYELDQYINKVRNRLNSLPKN